MKSINEASKICNIVLGVIYVPLSLYCFLLQMVSEGKIGATNSLYIGLTDLFCYVALLIPVLCIVGIVLSVVFRKDGHGIVSLVVQFVPLIVFLLDLLLLEFAESVPAVI